MFFCSGEVFNKNNCIFTYVTNFSHYWQIKRKFEIKNLSHYIKNYNLEHILQRFHVPLLVWSKGIFWWNVILSGWIFKAWFFSFLKTTLIITYTVLYVASVSFSSNYFERMKLSFGHFISIWELHEKVIRSYENWCIV